MTAVIETNVGAENIKPAKPVAKPAAVKPAKPAKKAASKKSRKSKVARIIWKQRSRIMKTALFAVLAVALYIVLGQKVAFTNNTALVVTLLGQFGAFTYKGVVGLGTFLGLAKTCG
jgi:hypothetical protein